MRLSGQHDATPQSIPGPVRLALEAAGYVLDAATPKHRRRFAKEAARLWGRVNPPPDGAVVKAAERLVRTRLIDAVHAAEERGELSLDYDDRAEGEVAITFGELLTLLSWFFPDDYPTMVRPPAEAADSPPGSPARIATMTARHARGEALYSPADPGMISASGRPAKIVERANGSGRKVLGWDDNEAGGEPGADRPEPATGLQKPATTPSPPRVVDACGWVSAPGFVDVPA